MSAVLDKQDDSATSAFRAMFAFLDLVAKFLQSKKHIWLTIISFYLFVGYTSWAVYAWQRGFPIFQLLNSQYLLTGFFSVVYCALLIFIFSFGAGVVSVYPRGGLVAVTLLPGTWIFLWLVLLLSIYLRGINLSAVDVSSTIEGDGSILNTIFIMSFVLLTGGWFCKFSPLLIKEFSVFDEESLTAAAASLVVFFGLIMFPLGVMPIVPQQFGGTRPLCAVFTLDRSKFDKELLGALGISSRAEFIRKENQISQRTDKISEAVRSKELSVVSIDDIKYILNLNDFLQGRHESVWNTVEIPRASILAISWCRAKGPYWISDNLWNMFGLPRDAETGS